MSAPVTRCVDVLQAVCFQRIEVRFPAKQLGWSQRNYYLLRAAERVMSSNSMNTSPRHDPVTVFRSWAELWSIYTCVLCLAAFHAGIC